MCEPLFDLCDSSEMEDLSLEAALLKAVEGPHRELSLNSSPVGGLVMNF